MFSNNLIQKTTKILSLFATLIVLNSNCEAKIINSIGESEGTTENSIFELQKTALLNAEASATEQCEVFIRSETTVKNYKVTEKQISQIAPRTMKVLSSNYNTQYIGNKIKVICSVQIELDEDLDKYIRSEIENTSLKNENQKLKKQLEENKKRDSIYGKIDSLESIAVKEGRHLYKCGQFNEALKRFETGVKINPNDLLCWEEYFELLLTQYDYSKVAKCVEKILKQEKYRDWANGYYYYARACLPQAPAFLTEPSYLIGKQNRVNNKNAHNAIQLLQRAIEFNCTKKDLYAWIGLAHAYAGDIDTAVANINYSINANNDAFSYYAAGKVCEINHDNLKAIEMYKKSIKLNPQFGLAYKYIYIAYKSTGQYKLASSAISAYIANPYRAPIDILWAENEYKFIWELINTNSYPRR